jgi:cysteine desulfurase
VKKNSTNRAGPVYLDCNASTPIEPRVLALMTEVLAEPGNAASRTHEYGARAKQIVQHARAQVARVVSAQPDEVVFTSGATESDNLAILGLAAHGRRTNRRHIVTTAIEHKAVLEPMQELARTDFELTVVPCTSDGFVEPDAIRAALRPNTLLVSVMHVNNETGVRQPLQEIAGALGQHEAYFHVDAAQGFGKADGLESHRIDLISISSHKVYGPQGIGALVVRRRANERIPLHPILYGGGHERGFRSGTLPTALIAGFGLAAELARTERRSREQVCLRFRRDVHTFLDPFAPEVNGDEAQVLPHVLNVSLHGIDGEAAIVALKDVLAFSNGSACTSAKYEPSHVLRAMGLEEQRIRRALRFSWSHLTPTPQWGEAKQRLARLGM